MQTLTDTILLSKWRTCKAALQAECNLVRNVQKDKAAFAEPTESSRLPSSRCSQVQAAEVLAGPFPVKAGIEMLSSADVELS